MGRKDEGQSLMREIASIIYTATDLQVFERTARAAVDAMRLAERDEERGAEKAAETQEVADKTRERAAKLKAAADQRRLEAGRALIEVRKQWKRSGPNARGWGQWLEEVGLPQRTAHELMRLAGFVDEVSAPLNAGAETEPTDIPSRRNIIAAQKNDAGAPGIPNRAPPTSSPNAEPPATTSGRGKPEWLMRALVRHYSAAGQVVCDPFAGYGSTLRAALDEGRQAIGSEIDEDVAKLAGKLNIRVGRWQEVLDDVHVGAVICDPPYSARTHAAETTRKDGSSAAGLTPTYGAWSEEDVQEFVAGWSRRCSGWMVALTDSELIPAYRDAYRANGRYAFAPIPVVIKGMSVRISGDGPSSWSIFAMVARPMNEQFVKWGTLPGAYVGTKTRETWDLHAEDVA